LPTIRTINVNTLVMMEKFVYLK